MSQQQSIFVVDDEAAARDMIGDYLKMHGFDVTLCDGGPSLRAEAEKARPDLVALEARYQAAEKEVCVAASTQFPRVSIGTGISLTLPVFSKYGGPAIRTALARRDLLRQQYRAAVHTARREVADAHLSWLLAQREFEMIDTELLPTAERNLELGRAAMQAGEATLLEILALQRSLAQLRTRHTEARAERSKRTWTLLAVSGTLRAEEPRP